MSMLYDIMEPEEAANSQVAVGIDFGTTNSLIAVVQEGKCFVIADDNGQKLLPSIVAYHNNKAILGAEALNYAKPIHSIKRLLGRRAIDVQDREEVISDASGAISLNINGVHKLDVEIAADIFKALKARADKFLNFDVRNAVITVPAYFDDAERNAVKAAAQLARFNVLRLINEPTAAAYAYGLEESPEGLFLVYDLGGGTFDVSILHMQRGVFEVIATGGDNQLGGDDLDLALCKFLCKQQGVVVEEVDPTQLRPMLLGARRIKQYLTEHDSWQGTYGASEVSISRAQFEKVIEPYIKRTMDIVTKVIKQAGVEAEEINKLLLVGGATRIPYIKALLVEDFEVLDEIDADQIVVQGAAQKAYALSAGGGGLLIDVTPLSLGLELADGVNEILIPRNSAIPAQHKHIFTTSKDGQTGFVIHVLQGEGRMASQCRSLAKFHLHNLPALPAGTVRLELTFQIDADGILTVKGHELTSGLKQQVLVKPSYGLSETELLKLLADAEEKNNGK